MHLFGRVSKIAAGTETAPKILRPVMRPALASDQVPDFRSYSSAVAERFAGNGLKFPPMAKTRWPKTTKDAPALGYRVLPVEAQVLVAGLNSSAVVSLIPGTVDKTRIVVLDGRRVQLKKFRAEIMGSKDDQMDDEMLNIWTAFPPSLPPKMINLSLQTTCKT